MMMTLMMMTLMKMTLMTITLITMPLMRMTDKDDADKDASDDDCAYLAALAAMDAVVEARGLVPADATQHAVVTVKFWG